jgi:hypothetical protein
MMGKGRSVISVISWRKDPMTCGKPMKDVLLHHGFGRRRNDTHSASHATHEITLGQKAGLTGHQYGADVLLAREHNCLFQRLILAHCYDRIADRCDDLLDYHASILFYAPIISSISNSA